MDEDLKPEIRASLTHIGMRLDGSDFICDACGAVSGDFELFEEVGVENECNWTSTEEYIIKEEPVEETVSAKTYTELVEELIAARENPENQRLERRRQWLRFC